MRRRQVEPTPSARCTCDGRVVELVYRLRLQGEDAFAARYGQPCPHVLAKMAAWPPRESVVSHF